MSRVDRTADSSLVETIANFKTELDEFKGRQRTSGRSGVLGYQTSSANTWDLTGTIGLDSDTSSLQTNFTVTFTGDGSQQPVIANLSFVVYVQMGSSPMVQLTPVVNYYQDGNGRNANLTYNEQSQTQLVHTATFYLLTTKQVKYYIKVYAVGSSRGTIGATSP